MPPKCGRVCVVTDNVKLKVDADQLSINIRVAETR